MDGGASPRILEGEGEPGVGVTLNIEVPVRSPWSFLGRFAAPPDIVLVVSPAVEHRRLDHCKISADSGPITDEIADGLILTNGDQATIYVYDTRGKAHQVDRLTAASMEQKGRQATIVGRSSWLDTEVKVPPDEQIVKVTASNWKRCANC